MSQPSASISGEKLGEHRGLKFSLYKARLREAPRATSEKDFRLTLELPGFRDWKPGQFVMLRWGQHVVGRPFAIVDWKPLAQGSKMELWVRRLGAGTEDLFKTLKAGAEVDLTAPLGTGLPDELMSSPEPILFLSGGVGGASILPLVRARRENGATKDFWAHGERAPKLLDRELVRGTSGVRPEIVYFESSEGTLYENISVQEGRITRLFDEGPAGIPARVAAVVACGPSAMLEALTKVVGSKSPERWGALDTLYLGLEEKMGCGIGLCFSCSVLKTHDGPQRCCIEGPWFRASEIASHFDFRRGIASATSGGKT